MSNFNLKKCKGCPFNFVNYVPLSYPGAKNKIIKLGTNIHEISEKAVPKIVSTILGKILPEFSVYTTSVFYEDIIYGNISIITFKDTPKINEELLFTFLNGASNVIGKLENKLQLEESNNRFELATSATDDIVWDLDLKKKTIYRGIQFYKKFEISESENNLGAIKKIIHPDDLESYESQYKQYVADKNAKILKLEYRIKRADNTYAWISDSGKILRDKNGKAYRIIGAMKDMTSTKQYLEAIQRQNKRLQTISWIQSHELRAPLSRILGIAELMKQRDLDEELFEELLDNIIKSSSELDAVVKSIVDNTDLK